MKSIRRHLSFTLLSAILSLAVITGVFAYMLTRSRLVGEFDRGLLTEAQSLVALVSCDSKGHLEFDFAHLQTAQSPDVTQAAYFEIREANGNSVYRSPAMGAGNLAKTEAGGNPIVRDTILPNGQHGRTIALQFTARPDDEDEAKTRSLANAGPSDPALVLTLQLARDTRELRATLRILGSSLLLAGLGLAGATVLLVSWAVRRGLSPLNQLSAQADEIDENSLDQRFSQASLPRELRPIAARLNELLDRLAGAFARERRFTSAAAHELRTPIAELRAMAEVALRWPKDSHPEQTCKETLEIANQMESIVATLLALARCEQNRVQARMGPVDLAELVREITSRHAGQDTAKVSLQQQIPEQLVIRSDRSLLVPLIFNLISNAFTHTPPGGSILCRVAKQGSTAELSLANTCTELDGEDLDRLFEPFWRKDQARMGGIHYGLGLSLVSAYAQILGVEPRVRLTTGQFQVSIAFALLESLQGESPSIDAHLASH